MRYLKAMEIMVSKAEQKFKLADFLFPLGCMIVVLALCIIPLFNM